MHYFLAGMLQLANYLLNNISVAHMHICMYYEYKITEVLHSVCMHVETQA